MTKKDQGLVGKCNASLTISVQKVGLSSFFFTRVVMAYWYFLKADMDRVDALWIVHHKQIANTPGVRRMLKQQVFLEHHHASAMLHKKYY